MAELFTLNRVSLHELDINTKKAFFSPESKEVEAMPIFTRLKVKMDGLGWVYDGSLRWSRNSQFMRVVYSPDECAVMELWHTDGVNELMRRIGTDCDEQGLNDALKELRIDKPK